VDNGLAVAQTSGMPLEISPTAPTILIRKDAFERSGFARSDLDVRYNLTADEFRVEGQLIVIGPLYDEDALSDLTDQFEARGLVYFEDFFDLSGNWPEWCKLYAAASRSRQE
jgi:hypothetical protein